MPGTAQHMAWLSTDSGSVLNTAILLSLPAAADKQCCMFAQSRTRAYKPQRPMLSLSHSMGWNLSSCCPQICWRKLYAGRSINISESQLPSCKAGTEMKVEHRGVYPGCSGQSCLCRTPTALHLPVGCICWKIIPGLGWLFVFD